MKNEKKKFEHSVDFWKFKGRLDKKQVNVKRTFLCKNADFKTKNSE